MANTKRPLFGLCLHAILIVSQHAHHTHKEFGDRQLSNIFRLMSREGSSHLAELKAARNTTYVSEHTSQYLVVAVLSEREIDQSGNWEDLNQFKTRRLGVFLNQVVSGECNLQINNKPVHGEVLSLYWDDGLEAMYDRFVQEGHAGLPVVLVFSYYIPCADVKDIHYSCSEELGKEARTNANRYQMLVAYETVFKGTNERKAKQFMCQGDIQIYTRHFDTVQKINCSEHRPGRDSSDGMFQEVYLDKLSKSGTNPCTSGETCTIDANTPTFTWAAYIDNLCYECTHVNNTNMQGPLTELSREIFLKCAKNYIVSVEGTRCNKSSNSKVNSWLTYLTMEALHESVYIGEKVRDGVTWERRPSNQRVQWEVLYPMLHGNATIISTPCMHNQNIMTKLKSTREIHFLARNKARLRNEVRKRH